MLLLSSILIIYEWLEVTNNKNKDLKTQIYHIASKTILQHTYPSFFSIDFKITNTNNLIALLEYKDDIILVYANRYKRYCYFVLAGLIVDYKE